MSNTTSASSATAPSATGNAPIDSRVAVLTELIQRAEAVTERMSQANPARKLIGDLSVALVAHAHRVQTLEQQLANKPRIILP